MIAKNFVLKCLCHLILKKCFRNKEKFTRQSFLVLLKYIGKKRRNKLNTTELSLKRFANFMAFLGTVLVATALIVKYVLTWIGVQTGSLIHMIGSAGELVAYIVLISVAYFYVKTKRKPIWYVIYAICVTAILILAIMNFIL